MVSQFYLAFIYVMTRYSLDNFCRILPWAKTTLFYSMNMMGRPIKWIFFVRLYVQIIVQSWKPRIYNTEIKLCAYVNEGNIIFKEKKNVKSIIPIHKHTLQNGGNLKSVVKFNKHQWLNKNVDVQFVTIAIVGSKIPH